MKCIYFRVRSRKYEKYFYCKEKHKKIDFFECKNCSYKKFKTIKELKKKSNKLKKLESNRYSIITNNLDICYICKKAKKEDLHEIFGGSNRQTSMKYGLVIPVCRKCHERWKIDKNLRQELQNEAKQKFKATYTAEFIKVFGKNFV